MSLQAPFVSDAQASFTPDPLLKNHLKTPYVQKITHKLWLLKKITSTQTGRKLRD